MITAAALLKIAPTANRLLLPALVVGMNDYFPDYQINSNKRLCHFLAQVAHESAGFRTLREYASGQAYEWRADLGNDRPGDGRRYKGRGLIQLTGRANYRRFGARLGLQLEANPEIAAQPHNAVRLALEYWSDRKLNKWADRDDLLKITRLINGGYNGLTDRRHYLERAQQIWRVAA